MTMMDARKAGAAMVLLVAVGCQGSLEQGQRELIESSMQEARSNRSCLLAQDALNMMEEAAERASNRGFGDIVERRHGWSKEDNQWMIDWKAETKEICDNPKP